MPLVKKPPAAAGPPAAAPVSWQHLAAQLQHGTAEERWAAARALGHHPPAVAALAGALAAEPSPRLREAIFTSLVRLNSPGSFAAALPFLRADEAALRNAAFDALALMPDHIATHLPALLRDADPDIRILACDLARHIPPTAAAPLLAAVLETEPLVNVCAAAADVLAASGSPATLPALAACAARHPGETFLAFAIRVAQDRIKARIEA